jgi:hypothetical protein
MKRLLLFAAAGASMLAVLPAGAITFDYEQFGSTIVTDCPGGVPPQPLCAMIDATGDANDVPDVIPGHWLVHLQGQILFFMGAGTFSFDDPSAANNDFSGTWTNVLFPPDPVSGFAHTTFQWVVTGGTVIFAGRVGTGASEGDVVVAPFGFDQQGLPLFNAACDQASPGLGSYCDRGRFVIAEPALLPLLGLALAAAMAARRRRSRSSIRARST